MLMGVDDNRVFRALADPTRRNLLDRLFYGHVIDFLDFHFGSYIYPTFNVADSGICVGVGIYLLYSLFQAERSQK